MRIKKGFHSYVGLNVWRFAIPYKPCLNKLLLLPIHFLYRILFYCINSEADIYL